MILFLVLLLLVGGLIYYWQKDPLIYENFALSDPASDTSSFTPLLPTVDVTGQPMTGQLYMFYAITTYHLPGISWGTTTSLFPNLGSNWIFNDLVKKQLRLATTQERAYFLRNGGINRENTDYFVDPEMAGRITTPNEKFFNTARLFVSTKAPNERWDKAGQSGVSFTLRKNSHTEIPIAIETSIQPGTNWIGNIIRYSFTDSDKFNVFSINEEEYTKSISDCLYIGKKAIQELSIKGITQIELSPDASGTNFIATGNNITYYDTQLAAPETTNSSSARAITSQTDISGSYTENALTDTQTSENNNIREKLRSLVEILDTPNKIKRGNANLSYRQGLQQRCGLTLFQKNLVFKAAIDKNTCRNALNTLFNYNIIFNSYKYLSECTLCSDANDACRPAKNTTENTEKEGNTEIFKYLPRKTSLDISGLELPATGDNFERAMPDISGVTLDISNVKIGNGFKYEIQLVDESETSSKYIFNPIQFTAGKINDARQDITNLQIRISEDTQKIRVFTTTTTNNQQRLLEEVNYPPNFKLYSSIKLCAYLNTFANKSIIDDNREDYSISINQQEISDIGRYKLYKSKIYSHVRAVSVMNFEYSNANTIQATFTLGNKSRNIPNGTYGLTFSNPQSGSFLTNDEPIVITQFNQIVIDVLTGKLTFKNNNSDIKVINTTFKEIANERDITLALNDPTNTQTYYKGDYKAFGNRYIPNASSATDTKEVVYLETPITDGLDIQTAIQVVRDMSGVQIATIEQVQNAVAKGANWCTPGWCKFIDSNGKTVYRAAYPITSQITDEKCIVQDNNIPLYSDGIIVVSTPPTLKSNLMVYLEKSNSPSNVKNGNLVYKQSYFNALTGKWKQSSSLDISNNEIFAITAKTGVVDVKKIAEIASTLGCTIATEKQIIAQLDYIKGRGIPLPNIPVVGWALDNSNFPIKIKLDGKMLRQGNDTYVTSLYCYGNKAQANAQLGSLYKMESYNAQLGMDNQVIATYKPLYLKTQPLIDKADQYNVKAALIVKEVQQTPNGIIKRNNTQPTGSSATVESFSNEYKYIGCDINSKACVLDGSGEKQVIPLLSKTNKFQIMEMQAPPNSTPFNKPATLDQAIQNVLDCQAQGGDVAITDETYPGCPAGFCCEAVDPPDNTELNASMFPETCDDSNLESAVDKCDETEEVLPLHQQSFEPYKLTRIQRSKTPTTAKCSKPKLSKQLNATITEKFQNTAEYIRDVYEIARNERLFSLRMR